MLGPFLTAEGLGGEDGDRTGSEKRLGAWGGACSPCVAICPRPVLPQSCLVPGPPCSMTSYMPSFLWTHLAQMPQGVQPLEWRREG